jgi:ribonuclease HII
MAVVPTLELESELFASGCKFVAGVDEVGRGALAGPVTIAIAVIDANVGPIPNGLRDSKLITKSTRERLISGVEEWVVDAQIASASAQEIDEIGITAALRLAFHRALANLVVAPDQIILDGKHNWIASKADDLFSNYESCTIPVLTKIKADASCASVAAASVLAKVSRDAYMTELSAQHPQFGWASNVGYGAAEHMAAIVEHGPTAFHRRSWNLPKA